MKSSSLISFRLQAVSLERISKALKAGVGGDATGEGIKPRRQTEAWWDVSWTEKFFSENHSLSHYFSKSKSFTPGLFRKTQPHSEGLCELVVAGGI